MSWHDVWQALIGGTAPPVPDAQVWSVPEWACRAGKQSAATLPRNLKRLREAKGLSPTRLANQAGISASYLRWLENAGHPAKILPAPGDTVNPGIVICLRLARVLECGIEELVEGREP